MYDILSDNRVIGQGAQSGRYTVNSKVPCMCYTRSREIDEGIATPQHEIDIVRRRLADAEQHYRERQN